MKKKKSVMDLIEDYYFAEIVYIYQIKYENSKGFYLDYDLEKNETDERKLIGQTQIVSIDERMVDDGGYDNNEDWYEDKVKKFYGILENGGEFEIESGFYL